MFLFLITQGNAQSRKRLRELEKMEQSHQVDEAAAEAEARQRHMDIQSKQTKKEMKRYKKMSKRYNNNKREPILKRTANRKRR